MASLMDDLLGVLESEEKEYRTLIELSENKRQVIIAGNVPELEIITGKEQDVTDILHKLELRRAAVLKDMAVVLGKDTKDLTIEKMIKILEKQPEEQQHLMELRKKMHETLNEMALINTQNQVLIKHALEMVEFDLTLFKSLRQAPETANYNSSAYNTGDLLGSGGFDAKQ